MLTSTTLLIGRIPAAVSRRAIQSGEAVTAMPEMTVAVNRPQRVPSTISTLIGRSVAGDPRCRRRRPELHAELGREVTGDADVAPTVGTVPGDVGIDQHIRTQPERVAVRHAERGAGGQDGDPGVVVAESELAGRAQHAFGVDAENAAPFDRSTVRHRGAERGEGHDVVGLHVERAAPHVAFGSVAGVDVDALHLGRVGMLFEPHDPSRDDAVDRRTELLDRADLEAEGRQRVGDPLHRGRIRRIAEVPVFVEPRQEDLHQNCSRKRTSLVNMSRMSSTP